MDSIATQFANQVNLNTDNSLGLTLATQTGQLTVDFQNLYNNNVALEVALKSGLKPAAKMGSSKELEEGKEHPDILDDVADAELRYSGIVTCSAERPALEDHLNRSKLVHSLARMFSLKDQDARMTIGLFGHWGSGKSTVMSLLQKELSAPQSKESDAGFDFLFGWFNVWEYEHTKNIRAGLAQEVINGLLSDGTYDGESPRLTKPIGFWRKAIFRIRYHMTESRGELLWLFGKVLAVLGTSIYGWLSLGDLLDQDSLVGAGALSLGVYWGWLLFKKVKFLWQHPLATELATFFKLPSYRKELGQVPVMRKQLETLCKVRLFGKNRWLRRSSKPKRLVLFVDDLDRCQTKTIGEAFDAIRLIADIDGVIIIVGIDERIAFRAMEESYKDYSDPRVGRTKEDVARDYLGKIIQVPIRLEDPATEDVSVYISSKLFSKVSRPKVSIGEGDGSNVHQKSSELGASQSVMDQEYNPSKLDKVDRLIVERMEDTEGEVAAFFVLSQIFEIKNPRQLLRLRNSYRLLKALYPRPLTPGLENQNAVRYPEGEYDLLLMLFWLEFRMASRIEEVRSLCEKLASVEQNKGKDFNRFFRSDFIELVDSTTDRFGFRDVIWKNLETFASRCLLPCPSKEHGLA